MKINCAHTQLVELHKLQPNPKNPNKHPEKQIDKLAKIIDYQGQRAPIVVSKLSGFITKGHGRLMAIQKLGWQKAAVDFQAYENEAQEYADIVADNKIAELAEHDDAMMIDELKKLDFDDFDLLGMDDFELPEEPDEAKEEIEDDVPSNVETRCKPGDLWLLGQHRLICGDSTNMTDVERLMGGKTAEMVFMDPPYGFNYKKKSDQSTIQNDGSEFAQVISDAVSIIDQVIKPKEQFIWGDFKTASEFLEATNMLGKPKSCIVWSKPIQHRMHKFEPCHEFCWYWGDNGNPFFDKNVVESRREIRPEHPTMKPIDLITHLFASNKLKTVVDLFGGSGSTLIACEKTRRQCFMMELDPKFCDVILKRWENYSGQKAKLSN